VNVVTQIPILLVSGFLGSGKTTLVRHLLEDAQREGIRMAVISNEFGELGIDGAMLDQPGNDYVELEGGCVCCRLSDELLTTLQMLWERVHPDRLVIEASGVALPFDVQLNLWREPVSEWIENDVTVVVVNAEQLAEGRDLEGVFEQQVSSADLLVLNKLDLVAPTRIPKMEAALRGMEPEAPLIHAEQANIDPALLFPPSVDGARVRRHPPALTAHHHEQFSTEELALPADTDPEALVEKLRDLAPLRAKGFVETSAGVRLVQGVGSRIELSEIDFAPPAALLGRVLLIRRADR
jgi:cobalamin biosynthesis protein CobW